MTGFLNAYADAGDKLLERVDEMSADLPGDFASRMKGTVANVPKLIRSIENLIHHSDPTLSGNATYLKAIEAVEKTQSATTAAINKQSVVSTEWEAALTRHENVVCGFDKGSPDAERILNKFCAKDAAAQLQDMAAWLRDPTQGYKIGIIAKADPYVTNLSPEMVARFRTDFVKLHQPKLAAERDAMRKIGETVLQVAQLSSRVKASIFDPGRYAEIRDSKAKHTAAERDFLAALLGDGT